MSTKAVRYLVRASVSFASCKAAFRRIHAYDRSTKVNPAPRRYRPAFPPRPANTLRDKVILRGREARRQDRAPWSVPGVLERLRVGRVVLQYGVGDRVPKGILSSRWSSQTPIVDASRIVALVLSSIVKQVLSGKCSEVGSLSVQSD